MRRRRKKRKNSFFKYLFIFITPIILCVGGYYVYDHYFKPPGIPSVNKLIKEKKEIGFSDKEDNKKDIVKYDNPLPAFRAQHGNNPDIVGRLEIPSLKIDSLISRAKDNGYYLNYNLDHVWDELGNPFFDYRNLDLSNNRQINIYGHNTQSPELYDKLPLINLEAYVDKNIFDNYKELYLSIDEKMMTYEVVAVKILTDGNPEHMKLIFKNDSDFLSHMNRLLDKALYKSSNAVFSTTDRVLVIQICHFNPEGSYLLVICKEKK